MKWYLNVLIAHSAASRRCIPGGRVGSRCPWSGFIVVRLGRLNFLVVCRIYWDPLYWYSRLGCLILGGNPYLLLTSWVVLINYYCHSHRGQRGIFYPCWILLGVLQLYLLWIAFLGPVSLCELVRLGGRWVGSSLGGAWPCFLVDLRFLRVWCMFPLAVASDEGICFWMRSIFELGYVVR